MKLFPFVFFLSIFVFSCSKQSAPHVDLNLAHEASLITNLAKVTRALGIESIERISPLIGNVIEFRLNGGFRNLNGATVETAGATLKYKLEPDESITLSFSNENISSALLINSREKTFQLDYNGQLYDAASVEQLNDNQIAMLSLLTVAYLELTDKSLPRFQKAETVADVANPGMDGADPGLDDFNCRKTAVSFRTSRSSASEHVTKFANDYIKTHPDCRKIYGVDAGCLWEDYGCMATQEIECTGSSCK